MERVTDIRRFEPTDLKVGEGAVGLYASFLLRLRVPALISDRREVDT